MKLLIVWLLSAWSMTAVAAEAPVSPTASAPTILVLGDSLSAGYGISAEQGWVSLLAQRIRTQGLNYRVVNASISGDTTSGGLSRLPAALDKHKPAIVLIELGANDGLRGQPVAQMKTNLQKLADLVRAKKAQPVLLEMRIPSNYGAAYTEQFTRAFGDVGKASRAPVVPFFLAAIATDPRSFQDDGIHPVAAAQPKMLDAVWPTLKPLLVR